MGTTIGNSYSSLFSSLNGNYNAASSMSSVISQRSQIQNGSYAKLMKAYVKKVGNKTALDAYRTTGTTATSASDIAATGTSSSKSPAATTSKTSTSKSSASKKTGFLDSHLSSIGKTTTSRATAAGTSYLDKYLNEKTEPEKTGVEKAKAYAESVTGLTMNADGTITEKAATDATAASATGDGTTGTESAAASSGTTETKTDKYAGMKSSWLDNHLKQYDQDANVQTSADNSVAVDETIWVIVDTGSTIDTNSQKTLVSVEVYVRT